MRKRLEIYNNERRLKTILHRIETASLDNSTKKDILNFYSDCLTRGLSKARLVKYLYTLLTVSKFFKKPLKEATKTDLINFVKDLESRDYSEWTKHDYKIILKLFFRWLRKKEYPEEVKCGRESAG